MQPVGMQGGMQFAGIALPAYDGPAYDAEVAVPVHPYANKRPSISGYSNPQQAFSLTGSMRNLGVHSMPMAFAQSFQPAHPEDHYSSSGQGGGGGGESLADKIKQLADLKVGGRVRQ